MARTSAVERDSKSLVLYSAAKLIRTQGYAPTSLRHNASGAGMKAGSLYYHFSSKEEIVIEVLNLGVRAVHEEVQQAVQALSDNASAREAFDVAVAAHLRSLLELQDYTSANTRIFGQVPEHVRDATMAAREAYERVWTDLLKRMSNEGFLKAGIDLKLLRLFLISAMNGTLEWYQARGKRSVAQIARELSRTILHGVATSEADGSVIELAKSQSRPNQKTIRVKRAAKTISRRGD